MDKTTFNEYVENRYKGQMDYYSNKSAKNQKKYKNFQWVLIILSAATPVLAALSGKSFKVSDTLIIHPDLQLIVVIVSAIVAILTTGLKTFDYQELWISYRSTYEKLKPEIHYYNFNIGPYSATGIDKESLFVMRVESILDAEHMQWPLAKKSTDDQNTPGKETPAGTDAATTNTVADESLPGGAAADTEPVSTDVHEK